MNQMMKCPVEFAAGITLLYVLQELWTHQTGMGA
jgi:hypothetical protein